jgi:hypothetical protein
VIKEEEGDGMDDSRSVDGSAGIGTGAETIAGSLLGEDV